MQHPQGTAGRDTRRARATTDRHTCAHIRHTHTHTHTHTPGRWLCPVALSSRSSCSRCAPVFSIDEAPAAHRPQGSRDSKIPQKRASSRLRSDGDWSSRPSTISVANSSSSCHATLSGVGAPRLARLPDRPLVLTGIRTPSSLSCVSRALLPPELSSTSEERVPNEGWPPASRSRRSPCPEAHLLIRRSPHQHATAMNIPNANAATSGPKTLPELFVGMRM